MPITNETKQKKNRLDRLLELIGELPEPEQVDLINQLERRKKDQRGCERRPFSNEVSYSDNKGFRQDSISDISETGIFIETRIPIAIGERITLTFPVDATSKHLKFSGEIVRKSINGIGVKFHPLVKETQDNLRKLLDTLDSA